jgi:serine/threonine protein kinase
LPFRAPELLSDQGVAESVIWTAGVFLYYITVGRLPFGGVDDSDITGQILRSRPVIPATLSVELSALLLKMFVKNPFARINADGLGRDPWMDNVTEAGRAVFFDRRRSLPRAVVPKTSRRISHDDADVPAVATTLNRVRLTPKRTFMALRGSARPGELPFPKFADRHVV